MGKFTDVAFQITMRTVTMSPSYMCVVPLLNFGKCFKAYFLLKQVPMLSGLEVGSVLSVRMLEHVLKLYLLQFVQMFQVSSQFPFPNFGEDVETSYLLNLVMELSNLEMGLVVHLMI